MKLALKQLSSLIFATLMVYSLPVRAGEPEDSKRINQTQGTNAIDATCNVGSSRADLDINNVRARYLNQGDMFWDPSISQARYEVPKRTDLSTTPKFSVFAAAIWLGGVEKGTDNVVVMVQTYRGQLRNYWPGPINTYSIDTAYTTNNICSAWDQHFKCNRSIVKKFVDDFEADPNIDCDADIPLEIKFWPGKGNPFLKQKSEFAADPAAVNSLNKNLANFFDRDSNGIYNPCKGDYPLWAGTEKDKECAGTDVNINSGADQVLWWVCNDVGNKKNFSENTSLVPGLGMEIHYEAFAYASTDATNDMTFLRQKLYNKGNFTLENTYLAQWMDPDLGNAGDDYVGCDVLRGLGICYNGDDDDEGAIGYGANPPAVAVDFFRGPFPDDPRDVIDWDLDCVGPSGFPPTVPPDTNERITMSGFVYYNIGNNPRNGDPTKFSDFYNYLRNKWKDGSDISFGGAGLDPVSGAKPKAQYMFPNVTESSDPYGFACTPSDQRNCQPKSCGSAWNEKTAGNPPGDRRFLANNGPFTLKPGSVNECTIGIVWARASSGGATGSFGKLLSADDLAQERFNSCFKRNVGPDNADLEITELDRKLIFNIIPDTIVRRPLMTTQTYIELNRTVTGGTPEDPQDVYFRFQGYKIFQLVDDRVSVQDLDNPDKARLVDGDVNGDSISDFNGIMDIQDGITDISNLEFNPDFNTEILTPMVKGAPDKGIFRSFQVERDMFSNISGGKVSNFKKYYYAIVAYGFNDNKQAKRPYIQGVLNYKTYTAIPHKPRPESFGTLPGGKFGQGFEITRLLGTGNSGNLLELKAGEEEKILKSNAVDKLTYQLGKGPIDIKIYNPKAVRGGKFNIRLSSRLRYAKNQTEFKVGDVLESSDVYTPDVSFQISPRFAPKKGLVKVKRILPVSGFPDLIDLDVDLLDCNNGDFSFWQDKVERDSRSGNDIIISSNMKGVSFGYQGVAAKPFTALEFVKNDFWKLTELGSNDVIYSSNPISQLSEELIPKYGISLRPKNGITPGTNPFNEQQKNGAIGFEVILDIDPAKVWTFGVPNSLYNFFRTDKFATENIYYALDPLKSFQAQAETGWTPYILSSNAISPNIFSGGPQIPGAGGVDFLQNFTPENPAVLQALTKIGNIDVVLTNDKSKWTRCAVLQFDTLSSSDVTKKKFILAKSRKPSVDNNFKPDNSFSAFDTTASKGMSYFPGYAIDLDRGVRLNLMFSESSLLDPTDGNNLKWEPRGSLTTFGTKSFIYVLNNVYDKGISIEKALDSIYSESASFSLPNFLKEVRNWNINNIMYVGLMARQIDFINVGEVNLSISDVRVKLRVQKEYQAYSNNPAATDCNPVYEFETGNFAGGRNIAEAGQSAMDLIRIVPNPYLSISGYENSQIDSRVKIVNIPSKCVVSIFNLSGTLVRQFNFDQTSTLPYASVADGKIEYNRGVNYQTFLEWDLKNQLGIPIASGVYIIHVSSPQFGDKVLKWFGVLRPIDLDTFN